MSNSEELKKKYKGFSDDELKDVVKNPSDYTTDAVDSAKFQLKKRNIEPPVGPDKEGDPPLPPTFFTLFIRGILIIIGMIPIAVILSLSYTIIPRSAIGGLFHAAVTITLFAAVWKMVSRINLPNPKILTLLIDKIKNLPTGWYRLSLILWFAIPVVIFSMIGSLEEAAFAAFVVFIFYWPLFFLTLWVVEGFRQK